MHLLNFKNLSFAIILQLRTQIIDSCSEIYAKKLSLSYIQMTVTSDAIQYRNV